MNDKAAKPWEWPEAQWREIVGRARAGRSLAPASWPNGARCCVSLSFDADHETIPLRDADESPMRISQGQYGSRQGVPRIRALLARHDVKASFFYPAVSALLHPEEVRGVADEGHEIGIHSPKDITTCFISCKYPDVIHETIALIKIPCCPISAIMHCNHRCSNDGISNISLRKNGERS